MITPESARKIKLLGLDVDGVLTDNAVWIAPIQDERVEFKRFDISDGLGLVVMRHTGIDIAWVSGRHSEATALRAKELRVTTIIQDNGAHKLPAMQALLDRKGIGWDELAYMGDDLADVPLLRRAGISMTVANACPEVKALASFVSRANGGHGAVREAVEGLLKARGEWDEAVRQYLLDRGETGP